MNSDIKLNGRNVEIIADAVIARALDIHLDHPARRSTNSGTRRALVHNSEDGLTINFNRDYPKGVTIEGATKMNGDVLFSQKTTVKDLLITDLPFTNYLNPNPSPSRGPFDSPVIRIPPKRSISFESPSSLVKIIEELRKEIGELKTKVNALESSARS